MKRVILLFLLVLLVPNGKVLMQEIPDCMCIPNLNAVFDIENRADSLWALDTCNIGYSGSCDSILFSYYNNGNRNNLYTKSGWSVWFKDYKYPFPNEDEIYFTWEDIKDEFQYYKQAFKALEDTFGTHKLYKEFPNIEDSLKQFGFNIVFNEYVNIVNVLRALRKIDSVYSDYTWILKIIDFIKENEVLIDHLIITPNPANAYIEINLTKVVESGLRAVSTGFSEGIRVYNAMGECVKNPTTSIVHTPAPLERGIREGVIKLDVSDLPVGVYFIRIGDAVKSFVKI